MSGKNATLILHCSTNGFIHDVAADVSVHGRQRIIHQDDVSIEVDGTRDVEPLLLPTGNGDTSLANLSLIPSWQHIQIWTEGTYVNDLIVPGFVIWLSEKDIFFDCRILNPGVLGTEGSASTQLDFSRRFSHVPCQCCQERALPGTNATNYGNKFTPSNREIQVTQSERC